MRVPLSWLRDFAPFEGDPVALGETFDDLGMVVEGIDRVGEGLDGVVIARVVDIQPIKGADRIRQVQVDIGADEPVQVVCGAWNFEVGAVVPFATVGSVLPGNFEIGRRKMKGVESHGMICSARELELGDEHAGIMVLADDLPLGVPFAEAMGITADVVFDLAIEGNRPDANCMAGVARDAAARLGLPFSIPEPAWVKPVDEAVLPGLGAPDLCPRFSATVFTNVAVGPSPQWMVRRLTLAGMRSINNLVDISNYVMLELGQPTHPYDRDRVAGAHLSARRARPGETVVTLDDVERALEGDDCVIVDGDDRALGIAGIMGGATSEISDATTTVLLEAAWFRPMAIARTSKRLNLRSEASARFERGCDWAGIERAVARFAELAGELAGARVAAAAMAEDPEHLPSTAPVRVRPSRVNRLLGTELSAADMARLIAPIGFEVTNSVDDLLDVVAPTFRPDIGREVDVIEEIARHHGYSNIARTVPSSPQVGGLTPYQRERRLVRDILVGFGVSEAAVSPLLGPDDHQRAGLPDKGIRATDPMVREESVLRASLLPGLLRAVAFNASHRNAGVRLFEIGKIWHAPDASQPLPDEREVVAFALGGADAADAKRLFDGLIDALRVADVRLEPIGDVDGLHPTRTARVALGGVPAGVVGEVAPEVLAEWGIDERVGWCSLDLALLLAAPRRPNAAQAVSRFPSTDIDLAFAVAEATPAGDVEAVLREAAGSLLVELRLFDVYRGTGVDESARSLAFRLRFNAEDRTLTDDEVAVVRARCIDAVQSALPATLRG
jgi:phenylalanyl-tRNA synthetase beta chain